MNRSRVRSLVVWVLASAICGAVLAQETVATVPLPFEVGKSQAIDLAVGDLRVTSLRVSEDTAPVISSLLPHPGGQGRFSWLRYSVRVENSTDARRKVALEIRLLDTNGAVIDEFVFDGRIGRNKYRVLALRRLTLNYVISLVDRVEVTARAL